MHGKVALRNRTIREVGKRLLAPGCYLAVALLAVALLAIGACGSRSVAKARLPMGVVDTPQPNQTISGRFTASGWAFADDGIKQLSVYVDLNYLMDCTYGASRPDVNKFFQIPPTENVGWTAELDTASLPVGKHEIVFAAESKKGAIRDLGIVPVTVTR